MEIVLDTQASPGPGNSWLDADGFAGPFKPGNGPRRDPKSEFPTGPEIGSQLPDVIAPHHDGSTVDYIAIEAASQRSSCSSARRCGDRRVARSWSSCNRGTKRWSTPGSSSLR